MQPDIIIYINNFFKHSYIILTIFISLLLLLCLDIVFIKLFKDKYQFHIQFNHKPIIILHSLAF